MKKIANRVRKTLDSLVEDGLLNFGTDLCGLCAIASFFLAKKLRKKGYDAQIYFAHSNTHVWVQVGKTIIDVTITQFGHDKKVFIGKKNPSCYCYSGRKITKQLAKDFFEDFESPFNPEIMGLLEERYQVV